MKCPSCGHDLDPPDPIPDPPYDNTKDGLKKCGDCQGSGDDPVRPGTACLKCDGSGWL